MLTRMLICLLVNQLASLPIGPKIVSGDFILHRICTLSRIQKTFQYSFLFIIYFILSFVYNRHVVGWEYLCIYIKIKPKMTGWGGTSKTTMTKAFLYKKIKRIYIPPKKD